MSKRKKKRNKTKVIYVRVCPEDHAQIERNAGRIGIDVAEFARLALMRPVTKADGARSLVTKAKRSSRRRAA